MDESMKKIIEDLILSCQNHKRGTKRIDKQKNINPEWEYYNMREEALTQALKDAKEKEGWEENYKRKLDEVLELETVLEAWHEAFGTTQLTHAIAKLEEHQVKAAHFEMELFSCKRELSRIKNISVEDWAILVNDLSIGTYEHSQDIAKAIHNKIQGV